MKPFIILIALVMTTEAGASSGADSEELPLRLIAYQTFNLLLLIGLLVYFLRSKLKNHLVEKHARYNDFLVRVEKAVMEAENSHKEILNKITDLEKNKEETLKKAHSEAADLRHRTLEEAKRMSSKLEHDARVTAENEIERAKEVLRSGLMIAALNSAEQAIKEKTSEAEKQKLQSQFVEKLQVVK